MKKMLLTAAALGCFLTAKAQLPDTQAINVDQFLGMAIDQKFTFDGKQVPNYGIGWFGSTRPSTWGPLTYISGYGGFRFFTQSQLQMTMTQQGHLGIGTDNPGSFRLAVEGMIGAREVNVTATNPFPDYVFENTYQLRPLAEVAKYVQQHKHLPEIPSAAEVEKNGINLGEMDALLLKKIEELTLYVIEQNKQLQELKQENQELKKEVSTLKK